VAPATGIRTGATVGGGGGRRGAAARCPTPSPDWPAMNADLRSAVHTLAAAQHSLVTRPQLRELGLREHQIDRLVRAEGLERISTRVLRIAGASPTFESRQLAAVLHAGPGAALSHTSALALWGIPGFKSEPAHVIRPHGPGPLQPLRRRGARTIGRLHVSRTLEPAHLTELDAIPIARPARALADIAGSVSYSRFERAAETAWSKRLLTGHAVHALWAALDKPGQPGRAALRRYLAERPPDYRPCESGLELRFLHLLAEDGQAPMDRQVDVGDYEWIGRIDFVDRPARFLAQIDSDRYHGSRIDRARDAAQTRALRQAGWEVERVLEFQVWHDPAPMLNRVRAKRAAGRRRHGLVRPA
jgi:very-short-patch-repair endonuclease